MQLRFFLVSAICISLFSCKKKENKSLLPDNLLYATRGAHSGIYDQQGRYILLRGVNYNALGDYWQANPTVATTKTFEENDLKLMASYGINCVRMIFSWSKLEPTKGNYDQNYIYQIKNFIETAAKYQIYVLLDMHQDAWGKYIATPTNTTCDFPNKGWDGAPDWATFSDSASTCTVDGSRESAPAVVHAFENFWENKNDIQTACINAWKTLVKATAGYSNVVGYDLINEPGLGYKPLDEESDKLSLFYKNTINAIRETENENNLFHHIIFFETSITWNGQAFPFIPSSDFTTDNNIIFAAHSYFEAISNAYTIEAGYDLLSSIADVYKTSMFLGEYGFFGNPNDDVSKLKRFAKKEDDMLLGSTWWQWAQAPGDPHGISWDGATYANTSMHLIELDKNGIYTGNKNDLYLNVLSRTRPNAICGTPIKFISNSDNGTMHLEANATSTGTTILWIPNRFGEPDIQGENITIRNIVAVTGGFLAYIDVKNNYTIDVAF